MVLTMPQCTLSSPRLYNTFLKSSTDIKDQKCHKSILDAAVESSGARDEVSCFPRLGLPNGICRQLKERGMAGDVWKCVML